MTYDLSNSPLKFENARQRKVANIGGYIIFPIFLAVPLLLDCIIWFGRVKGLESWKTVVALIVPWLLLGALFLSGFYSAKFSPDGGAILPTDASSLVFDELGVHVKIGERERNYLWPDILRASVVETHQPGNPKVHVRAVQIVRKGQILIEKYSDLIDESFGLTADQVRSLIQQGIEKWGDINGSPSVPIDPTSSTK